MSNGTDSGKPGAYLLAGMGILLAAVTVFAAFFSLREVFVRFSMDFYYPFLKLAHSGENLAAAEALKTKSKSELAAALAALQKKNMELAAENAALKRYESDNAQLRFQAKLKPPEDYRVVLAEVLTRDPATWNESFTIDRGEADGLSVGDLVLAAGVFGPEKRLMSALVGRLRSVSLHTATVSTLLNPDCAVAAYLPDSGARGVLRGAVSPGSGWVKITYLDADAVIAAGSEVSTSGYSEGIPLGIPLGTAAAGPDGSVVRSGPDKLYAEAMLKPLIDAGSLRYVAVLVLKRKKL